MKDKFNKIDEEILSIKNDFANPITQEIKSILDEGYNNAKEILTENITLLHAVAARLEQNETISGDEFSNIVKQYK